MESCLEFLNCIYFKLNNASNNINAEIEKYLPSIHAMKQSTEWTWTDPFYLTEQYPPTRRYPWHWNDSYQQNCEPECTRISSPTRWYIVSFFFVPPLERKSHWKLSLPEITASQPSIRCCRKLSNPIIRCNKLSIYHLAEKQLFFFSGGDAAAAVVRGGIILSTGFFLLLFAMFRFEFEETVAITVQISEF